MGWKEYFDGPKCSFLLVLWERILRGSASCIINDSRNIAYSGRGTVKFSVYKNHTLLKNNE